ncbi:rhodanese-like domain-containing protein [Marimonas arenosa]|uniref:Rhodanese-like domain-containing protein n=1 Tax=Marimonas arenosa TaxID=1795305 RepID=A0AAE3WCJ4_9RHOB|nr:rhodanese-like domain-containing protein [Marimonas arenosa]MDQ2089940.1 rhodanese-like domain-containing protein [Marimonas arenosa]
MTRSNFVAAILAGCFLTSAALADAGLPSKKQTLNGLYLTAAEAAQMLSDNNAVFIDVRSRSELTFTGVAERVDVHIPLMVMPDQAVFDAKKGGYRMRFNPDFVMAFETWLMENGYDETTPIVLICRSGARSAKAANILREMGYGYVWSVTDGFEGDKAKDGPGRGQRVVNGWKNAGLAWSYAIRPDQVYPLDRSQGS